MVRFGHASAFVPLVLAFPLFLYDSVGLGVQHVIEWPHAAGQSMKVSLYVESCPQHGDHKERPGQGLAPGTYPRVAQPEVCLTSLQVFLNPVK